MNVLHVYSGNLYGGIERILATLARHVDASPGLHTEVSLCFEGRLSRELAAAGTIVHQLGEVHVSRPRTVSRARRAFTEILGTRSFDVVVLHAAWSHALFASVARKRGVPIALWLHDAWTGRHWTERWARRAPPDILICNSRFTESTALAAFAGIESAVVYAPVDLPPAKPTSDERTSIRRQFATPDGAVVVVQAGRLESWKGHEQLIDALSNVAHRDWIWWQVGGPQRPREAAYLESLRARAERRGIADRVRFLGQREDVARIFTGADIHCQPNVQPEPFGVAFVEALAAGLPVVTTDIGGAAEIVDGTCGRLVAPRDSRALASVLTGLIADSALRARLGSAGRIRAKTLCEPAEQVRRFVEVVQGIVRRPAACLQR
jgi:glycosyltransferase involved in cell wall biosynthesis